MSALDSFWVIPPIQDAIARHLSHQDLTQCALVSHSFSTWATPFLFHHINLRSTSVQAKFFESATLTKYQHHIKTLALDNARDSFFTLPTTNLNLLSLTLYTAEEPEDQAYDWITFLEHQQSLQSFIVSHLMLSEPSLERWRTVLLNHKSLETLSFHYQRFLSNGDMISLLQSCVHLRKLRLEIDNRIGPPLEYSPCIGRFQDAVALKDLDIVDPSVGLDAIALGFLRHCPNLTRLSLNFDKISQEVAMTLIQILNGRCPQLDSLTLFPTRSLYLMDTILMGLDDLKSIHVRLPFPTAINLSFWNRHRNSLEHLDISAGGALFLEDFCSIVTTCPQLISLKVWIQMAHQGSNQSLEHALQHPWICSSLKVLSLRFVNKSTGDRFYSSLFHRISELVQLQDLKLRRDVWDASFGPIIKAERKKLAGLKQLRSLGLSCNPKAKWTEKDILAMVDDWPKLNEIAIAPLPDCLKDGTLLKNTLEEQRPRITIL